MGAEWQAIAVRSTLRASAAATVAGRDRWAVQAVGAGSWFFGPTYAPREMGAVGSVLRLLGVPASVNINLLARQHLIDGDVGAWVGGSAGASVHGSGTLAPVISLDGAIWRRGERWRATLAVSALSAWIDTVQIEGANPPAHFTALDVVGSVEWHLPRAEFAANAGVRGSAWGRPGPPASNAALALVSLSVPLNSAIAVIATAGNQYADPIRGAPAVRHVALGLRVKPGAVRTIVPRREPGHPAGPGDGGRNGGDGSATTLSVSGEKGERVVRVSAPGARRVELRSDATGWQVVELTRRGDHWEAAVALSPGTHRVMLRVDDGEWEPPGNLPTVDDDFGSRVGLLVVVP